MRCALVVSFFLLSICSNAASSNWRGIIHRKDGKEVVFTFELIEAGTLKSILIKNATEKILVKDVKFTADSVFFKMPVFESAFKAKRFKDHWDGVWTKGTSASDQVLAFSAIKNKPRFDLTDGPAKFNISGRWAVNFANDKSKADQSIAEFKQTGNLLTGTFLTPTGDYRYLEGNVSGNKMMLSGFDGGHAFLFTADIKSQNEIINGFFNSGAKYTEGFHATKDANATVSTDEVAMFLKPGESKLNFAFPDLNNKMVSINDKRFQNKVVIIQILGSWCPNCMDETAFLSKYYKENKSRGIEIIGLAYEYSTDYNRSVKSITKFKNKFDIAYPLLVTGVTVGDSLRTEKTLPQVTDIKVFPSNIFIDKKGNVRKFETGFFGPGTGDHFKKFIKDFNETVNGLLNE